VVMVMVTSPKDHGPRKEHDRQDEDDPGNDDDPRRGQIDPGRFNSLCRRRGGGDGSRLG
jgi:hypothetical protein